MTEGKVTLLSDHCIQTVKDRKVLGMLKENFWTGDIGTILHQTQNSLSKTHMPSEMQRGKQCEGQAQYFRKGCDLNQQSA